MPALSSPSSLFFFLPFLHYTITVRRNSSVFIARLWVDCSDGSQAGLGNRDGIDSEVLSRTNIRKHACTYARIRVCDARSSRAEQRKLDLSDRPHRSTSEIFMRVVIKNTSVWKVLFISLYAAPLAHRPSLSPRIRIKCTRLSVHGIS